MTDQDRTRRRWYQFRLRTLLIFMTLCAFPFAWVSSELAQRRREKPVIKWVEEMGGRINEPSLLGQVEKTWWRERTDEWFGTSVRRVILPGALVNDLSPLAGLKNLKDLDVWGTQVSDLTPLAGLKNLEKLDISNTPVSDLTPLVGLKKLKTLYLGREQRIGLSLWDEDPYHRSFYNTGQVQMLQKALPNCRISTTPREIRSP